jgi:hypothetical protein
LVIGWLSVGSLNRSEYNIEYSEPEQEERKAGRKKNGPMFDAFRDFKEELAQVAEQASLKVRRANLI